MSAFSIIDFVCWIDAAIKQNELNPEDSPQGYLGISPRKAQI